MTQISQLLNSYIHSVYQYIKVAEAEKKKAEAHAEHQRKAHICNKAEFGVINIHYS